MRWVQLCGSWNILWHCLYENWPVPVLGPLLSFPNFLAYCVQHSYRQYIQVKPVPAVEELQDTWAWLPGRGDPQGGEDDTWPEKPAGLQSRGRKESAMTERLSTRAKWNWGYRKSQKVGPQDEEGGEYSHPGQVLSVCVSLAWNFLVARSPQPIRPKCASSCRELKCVLLFFCLPWIVFTGIASCPYHGSLGNITRMMVTHVY